MQSAPESFAEDARRVSFGQWMKGDEQTIADLTMDGDDLSIPSRVYADFYAPEAAAEVLRAELERRGWKVLYFSSVGPDETAFLHTRKEKVWSVEELRQITPELYNLSQEMSAVYDGWFNVSVEEDDFC